VRDHLRDLEAAGPGLQVLVVTFAPVERLAAWRERLALPFPVAADPERRAYRAFGLLEGSRWAVWHPRVLLRYARLLLGGMRPQRAVEGDDTSQLGGDFVVDGEGRVLFAHRSERPDDRPSVDVLLRALAGATACNLGARRTT
jgi:peroxiredoxin